MEIIQCPKSGCTYKGGALLFRPSRPGTRPYPRIKHYDSSMKFKKTECYLSKDEIKQVEFTDDRYNIWKSVLDPKDWYRIESLVSRYGNDVQKFCNPIESETVGSDFAKSLQVRVRRMMKLLPRIEEVACKNEKSSSAYATLWNQYSDELERISKLDNNAIKSVLSLQALNWFIHEIDRKYLVYVRGFGNSERNSKKIMQTSTKISKSFFDPQCRDVALFCNFRGNKCPECNSWRTNIDEDTIEFRCKCNDCHTIFGKGLPSQCQNCSILLFDKIIDHMIATGNEDRDTINSHCPKCSQEITLKITDLIPWAIRNRIQKRLVDEIQNRIQKIKSRLFSIPIKVTNDDMYLIMGHITQMESSYDSGMMELVFEKNYPVWNKILDTIDKLINFRMNEKTENKTIL